MTKIGDSLSDVARIGPLLPRRISGPGPPDNRPVLSTGALLFADISGFTALTEKMGVLGRLGAEELTLNINCFFEKLITVIHHHRGDVLKFGGDALLVGFEDGSPPEEVVQCARRLLQVAERAGLLTTEVGRFRLGLHVGISFGSYHEIICGSAGGRREHFLYGRTIHRCQQAADLARSGEVVAAVPFSMKQALAFARPRQRSRGFYLLTPPKSSIRSGSIRSKTSGVPAGWWADFLDPQISSLVLKRRSDWIGEHRAVSVGFVFFKGSDRWSTKIAADTFERIFNAVNETVSLWGGVWGRSDPGSAYQKLLFLFGTPTAGENDPQRAVGFALDLCERLSAVNRDGIRLDFGIGLATGRLFCGFVGGVTRREYTVMGDAINLAARLAVRSFGGRITADQSTVHAATGRYLFRTLKPAKLKGKTGHIPLFRPVRARSTAVANFDQGNIEYYPGEFKAIKQFIRRREAAKGYGLGIAGEAGCGKSSLAQRVLREIISLRDQAIQVTIWPEEKSIAFSGLSRLFIEILAHRAAHPREFPRIFRTNWPKSIDPRWQALFAELLGFSGRSAALVRGLGQQARLEKLGELLPEVINAIAGRDGRVILIENYQWLDPSSKTALHRWWENIAQYSQIVIITGRDLGDIEQRWADSPEMNLVRLGAVDSAGISRLVRARFPDIDPPKRLVTALVKHSRLVPAIADAYLDYWRERGQIYRDPRNPRRLHTENLGASDLPDALMAAYVRRLDRLTSGQIEIMRAAAVWGGGVTVLQLGRLLHPGPAKKELMSAVRELVRIDCLTSSGAGKAPVFSIAHPLLAQAAYQTMSFAERRAGHTLAAEMWANRRGRGIAANLARHYLAAGNEQEALPALRTAAADSVRIGANQEARHFLQEADRLAKKQRDQQVRMEVCAEWAEVEQKLGNYDDARRLFSQADKFAQRLGRVEKSLLLKLSLGRLYWIAGKYDRGRQTIKEILRARASRGNHCVVGQARHLSGELLRRRGQFEKAEAILTLALDDFRKIEDKPGLLEVRNTLGIVCWGQGKLTAAADHFRQALKLGRKVVDLASRARLSNNLGILHEEQAHLKRARAYYQRAFAIFSEIGHRRNRAYCLGNLGNIDRLAGRFNAAREGYEEVLRETGAIGEAHAHAYTLGNLGDLYADFGDFASAAPYYRRTLAFARRVDDDELKAETLLRMATLACARGKPKRCSQRVAEAAELARKAGSEEFQIKAELMAVAIPRKDDDQAAVIARLHDTLKRARQARLILYEVLAYEQLSRHSLDAGKRTLAARHALKGLTKARKAGFVLCEIRLNILAARADIKCTGDSGRRITDRARKNIAAAETKITGVLATITDDRLKEIFLAQPDIRDFRDLATSPRSPARTSR